MAKLLSAPVLDAIEAELITTVPILSIVRHGIECYFRWEDVDAGFEAAGCSGFAGSPEHIDSRFAVRATFLMLVLLAEGEEL